MQGETGGKTVTMKCKPLEEDVLPQSQHPQLEIIQPQNWAKNRIIHKYIFHESGTKVTCMTVSHIIVKRLNLSE